MDFVIALYVCMRRRYKFKGLLFYESRPCGLEFLLRNEKWTSQINLYQLYLKNGRNGLALFLKRLALFIDLKN